MSHRRQTANATLKDCTDSVSFDEVDEGSSFDFDRLSLPVEKRQNEVKEIALAKVAGWLLLEVRPTQAHAMHEIIIIIFIHRQHGSTRKIVYTIYKTVRHITSTK